MTTYATDIECGVCNARGLRSSEIEPHVVACLRIVAGLSRYPVERVVFDQDDAGLIDFNRRRRGLRRPDSGDGRS